jgi:hypothetical protein
MWMKSGALLIYISSVFNFLYTFSSIHTVWGDFYTPVFKTGRFMVYQCPSVRFTCHAVTLEPLGQFTSNFTELLELMVLRSVYFMVKFRIFIPELWDFIHQIVRDFKSIFHVVL